jgi:hypothetical protein
MVINNRQVGFAWTTGAFVDYNDWVVRNQQASVARAKLQRAVIMNAEHLRIHKSKEAPLTIEELRDLPVYAMEELLAETDAVIERDSKREIETKESKTGKNVKSTAERSN